MDKEIYLMEAAYNEVVTNLKRSQEEKEKIKKRIGEIRKKLDERKKKKEQDASSISPTNTNLP